MWKYFRKTNILPTFPVVKKTIIIKCISPLQLVEYVFKEGTWLKESFISFEWFINRKRFSTG